MKLTRFWIIFEDKQQLPLGMSFGCGVTAENEADALSLIRTRIFRGHELPKISETKRNVALDELDQSHVRNNMGNAAIRGIWFPLGYES